MSNTTPNRQVVLDMDTSSEYHLYAFAKNLSKLPPYSSTGRKGKNWKTGIEGIDVGTVMMELSKDACTSWFYWFLWNNRNIKTNVVIIEPSKLDSAENRRVTKAYPVLDSLGWVKRFKNRHYLINPKVMICQPKYHASVCDHWLLATGESLGSYTHNEECIKDLAQSLAYDESMAGEIV